MDGEATYDQLDSDSDQESTKKLSLFGDDIDHQLERSRRTRWRGPLSRRAQLGLLAITGALVVALVSVLALYISAANNQHHCSPRESARLPEDVAGGIHISTAPPEEVEPLPWKSILLPQDVVPLSYFINMDTDLNCMEAKGYVNITLKLVNPTNFTVLHAKELNITDVKAYHFNNFPLPVKYRLLEAHQQLYVEFSCPPNPKKSVFLVISFNKTLAEGLEGYYISSYNNSAGEKRYLATTHFEPTAARSAFPCYDEPSFKAIFQLQMSHNPQYSVLFNSPLKERRDKETISVSLFYPTLRMSSYLVAFVVSDFKFLSSSGSSSVQCGPGALPASMTTTTMAPSSTTGSSFSIEEDDEGKDVALNVSVYAPDNLVCQAFYALAITKDILNGYKDFFRIAYPLPKLDLIAIPDFGPGAMENWGLVTFRTTTVLYTANDTSSESQEHVATVIAHELAHQWFGNLVTMEWWNDLWLNEGFATFLEFMGVHFVQPDWDMMSQFVASVSMDALELDSLPSSHAIITQVDDDRDIEGIFDAISYKKGAALVYMLQNLMGQDNLRLGLKLYLSKFRYDNARTQDLWNAFTQVYGILDVGELMETWTVEAGYPLITAVHSVDNQSLWVNQTKFTLNLGCQAGGCGALWTIPLSYITSFSPNCSTMHIFDKPAELISTPKKFCWVKLNVNQTGFYRVNYDLVLWQALINLLQDNHTVLSPSDRAGLLDDAFFLAKAGMVRVDIPLNMSLYLKSERNFVPWAAASVHLDWLDIMLQTSANHPDFEDYVLSLVVPVINELGWKDEGSHLTKKLRSLILNLGAQYGHQPTIDTAVSKFKSWKNSNVSVEPNFRSVVYSTGIKHGNREDWKFVFKNYLASQVPSERRLFLKALGSSTSMLQLQLYLQYTLDKNIIRPQDVAMVMGTVAANPYGSLLAWHFLRSNWDAFFCRFGKGSFSLDYIISSTTSHFSTTFDACQVKNFLDTVDLGAGSMAAQHSMERIQLNTRWRQHTLPYVEDWLQQHNNQTAAPT